MPVESYAQFHVNENARIAREAHAILMNGEVDELLGQRRSLSRAPCEASPTWNPSRRRPASLELQERNRNRAGTALHRRDHADS